MVYPHIKERTTVYIISRSTMAKRLRKQQKPNEWCNECHEPIYGEYYSQYDGYGCWWIVCPRCRSNHLGPKIFRFFKGLFT